MAPAAATRCPLAVGGVSVTVGIPRSGALLRDTRVLIYLAHSNMPAAPRSDAHSRNRGCEGKHGASPGA